MGRHWCQEKRTAGFKPCGRKSASGSKRKYPKVRPCCKSRTDDRIAKAECCCRGKEVKQQGVGGKPTNVATFAKRKSLSMGGLV